jgi:hypothetical protein
MRAARAVALALLVALAPAARAQQADGPSRPGFLAAMGLLQTREETVRHSVAPDFTITLPGSDDVTARAAAEAPASDDFVAAWEFGSESGAVETLTVTLARVARAPREQRRFSMANLLVLRSYAELSRSVPSARLLGFGPLERPDGLNAVEAFGTFETEGGRQFVFRHVGLMAPEREEALVVLVAIDAGRMPVRTDEELRDTFAGHALSSLRLLPDAADEGGAGGASEDGDGDGDEDGNGQGEGDGDGAN